MKRLIKLAITSMAMLLMLTGCSSGAESTPTAANQDSTSSTTESGVSTGPSKGTQENPFVLGVSPMSGWYAWYGIDETGIFENNGVFVDIKFFSVYSDSLTSFYSGQVDGICIAASDAIAPLNEGIDFKIVLVNDTSYGADGIVTQDGIESIEDLKGKTIATEIGTLEHMFLLKILEEHSMTIDDVNFMNMTINDAGPAFIAGSIDAAVLWEPTLSTAIEAGGNLLYSTKETPGLIPDTLAVQQDVVDSYPEAVQAIVDSWFDGVVKLQALDDTFIQAICESGELEYDDYMVMLDGVTILDKADNQLTFTDGNDFTHINYTLAESAEFLLESGMIKKVPDDVTVILDSSFIEED